ncbi:MAG: TonB-dependent receptor [Alphaproteobacteria bacterium]|nr:TonB-dependent receptor [Alphaproteobacteria bacterium]
MMNEFMARGLAVALALGYAGSPALAEQESTQTTVEVPTIRVEGTGPVDAPDPSRAANLDDVRMTTLPAGLDSGDILRSLPGVNAGRMGGHGLEPVIRGQQQNQLNVIDGGAFVFGACPNRMDPPTSVAALERADRIVVERGYHTVTNGPGGSGGTLRLERFAPVFEKDSRWKADVEAGISSNSETLSGAADVAVDLTEGLYARGFGRYSDAGNYENGDGDEVRTSFETRGGGLEIGRTGAVYDIALSYDYDLTEDALFPGAGMDSPEDEVQVWRLRGSRDLDHGIFRDIEANAYFSAVDHVMDNFSLRTSSGMAMRVPSESDTYGGRILARLDIGAVDAEIGADLQNNNRDATVYAGPEPLVAAADPARERFFMWPDLTVRQIGLFAEAERPVAARTRATLGARLDFVRASAGRAGRSPALAGGQTPNDLYRGVYGSDFASDRNETNVGGLLRIEHDLTASLTAFSGIARVMRTADATERGMARSNWVGNPAIDPEAHHQLDVGLTYRREGVRIGGAAYIDRVDAFILRDAFSVPGVTTYRNVDATLAGVEADGRAELGDFLIEGDLAYTWGENRTDDRALAQIPPLSGSFALGYGSEGDFGAWHIGGRMNWALKQGRIDPSRDADETPGYASFDLFGWYRVGSGIVVSAGVTNLMDVTYANHLNRSNVSDPTEVQVNEPGRTFFLKASASF